MKRADYINLAAFAAITIAFQFVPSCGKPVCEHCRHVAAEGRTP